MSADDRNIVIPLTVGRLNELVEEAYKRCGYQLVDFGDGGGKGVLRAPKKLISVVNTLQALLHNEIPDEAFAAISSDENKSNENKSNENKLNENKETP